MAIAVQLTMEERERLAQALGVRTPEARPGSRPLPLSQFTPRPDPVAWRKAETGHAVLATGGGSADIPAGAAALAGIWSHRDSPELVDATSEAMPASSLPRLQPVVVNTDVCYALGLGRQKAITFFEQPVVEPRLATATYLALLAAAEDEDQIARLRRFVQPFAVLSLGPMASSRAAELMVEHGLSSGLQPLDALIAATALAHEIPLVAVDTRPFAGIAGLEVCRAYQAE